MIFDPKMAPTVPSDEQLLCKSVIIRIKSSLSLKYSRLQEKYDALENSYDELVKKNVDEEQALMTKMQALSLKHSRLQAEFNT